MNVDVAAAYAFVLALCRTAALCMTAPLFGVRAISGRLRMAMAAAVTPAAFWGAGSLTASVPSSVAGIVGDVSAESLLGLAAGLAARFVFDAVYAAGHVSATSMGLGYGALLDPINGAESTSVGELLQLIALGTAVAAGIHREAFIWLAMSFRAAVPGQVSSLSDLAYAAASQAAYAGALAIRVAMPLLGAMTVGHLVLGVMNRAAPQINISSIGFTVSIVAGGGALYVLAPTVADVAAQAALRQWHSW